MSKYHARKTELDGILFDSKREAQRYAQLRLLQRSGEISNLRRQVKYELVPAQYESYARYGVHGKRLKDGARCAEKSICYIADFVYEDRDGNTIVEDAKGMRTDAYTIKRKLMRWRFGIEIREV